MRDQGVAQHSRLDVIGPGNAGRQQLVAAVGGTLPGAQDRRNDLVGGGAGEGGSSGVDVEVVLVDSDAVGAFAFDQNHAHLGRRHRDAKHDARHCF